MKWLRTRRPSPATGIAMAALGVALGGAAYAAIPDSNGTIHACYHKKTGDLRVVDSAGDCRKKEQALEWNQEGPAGPPGEGLVHLGQTILGSGEREVLLSAGPFTFTAFCREPRPSDNQIGALVEVTTSQDHSAVTTQMHSSGFARHELNRGETSTFDGPRGVAPTNPLLISTTFSAEAPDGTGVSGVFSRGVHVLNQPGKCTFGGHAVVRRGSSP